MRFTGNAFDLEAYEFDRPVPRTTATTVTTCASLAYFAPVVNELAETPLHDDYVVYLRKKLKTLAPT